MDAGARDGCRKQHRSREARPVKNLPKKFGNSEDGIATPVDQLQRRRSSIDLPYATKAVTGFRPASRAIGYRRAMDNPIDAWFVREILVHEAALVQYLRRCWSQVDELPDLRQEVYVRATRPPRRTCRSSRSRSCSRPRGHLMTDKLRRGRVVSIEPAGDFEALNVLVDEVCPSSASAHGRS